MLNFKLIQLVQIVYYILTLNIFVTIFLCYKILILTNHVSARLGADILSSLFQRQQVVRCKLCDLFSQW